MPSPWKLELAAPALCRVQPCPPQLRQPWGADELRPGLGQSRKPAKATRNLYTTELKCTITATA